MMNTNDLILKVKEFFPEYDVNINNVLDFYTMMEERDFDKNKLPESKSNPGYYTIYENNSFKMVRRKSTLNGVNIDAEALGFKLPAKFLDASLNTIDRNTESREKIYNYLVKFLKEFKTNYNKGLYLYGDFSIGKTYILAAIHNELLNNDISCIFTTTSDLILKLKDSIGTPKYNKIIDALEMTDVLLLDDLGSENVTLWYRDELLNTIFNSRLNNLKPVFISSNILPEDIESHLITIKNNKEEKVSANRIVSRMKSLSLLVRMDDSNKYKR